ncbi:hypothetical protein [Pseudomonas fragi]|uniref:hypothetical protein n=1 Tax=Pseudomonas fragi TaxID=296 RepID=UPI001472B877|nr:hypothetical protein [Pseudomonas fragi]NNB33690.1 hypothetical protein [Pseudomonas fragi]
MSITPISAFGNPSQVWSVPPEDLIRQATASLRGYVYQLHASAAAWLELRVDDDLYLEVAEDFTELLREPGRMDAVLRATQVKDTRESGAVTLNSPDILAAIESLHRLRACNPGREVRFVFLGIRKILLIQDFPNPKSQIDGCVDRAWLAQALDGPDNCLDGHAVIDR